MTKAAATATQTIDKLLGNTDFVVPSTLWVALYTVAPTEDGGGTEVVVADGYGRVQIDNDIITWTAAVSGTKSNAIDIDFGTPGGPWGAVVAFGLHTHATDDALYMYGVLEAIEVIGVGSVPRFGIGELTVEET